MNLKSHHRIQKFSHAKICKNFANYFFKHKAKILPQKNEIQCIVKERISLIDLNYPLTNYLIIIIKICVIFTFLEDSLS